MIEEPVFVPSGDDRIAAVFTLPDGRARSLVLLLPGMGANRSHRYRLWVRTARALAERQIASVRLEWLQVGDSTGVFEPALDSPPVEQVEAVAAFAMEALGMNRFKAVGNCMGAMAALATCAADSGCTDAGCILAGSPKTLLRGEGRTASHRTARKAGRRFPRLARAARRVVRTGSRMPRLDFLPQVGRALARADNVFFVTVGTEEMGALLERGIQDLVRGRAGGARVSFRTIVADTGDSFRLGPRTHDPLIESIVDWVDGTSPPLSVQPEERPVGSDQPGAALPA